MSWSRKIIFRLLRNKIIISYLIGGVVTLILYLVIITCTKILAPPVLTALSITLLTLIIGLPTSLAILALYYIVASVLAFRELKRKIFYIDDEINVLDSKNISKLFLRKTGEKTLITILEWIHRNVRFWNERYYLAIWPYIAVVILAVLVSLPSAINRLAQQYNLKIYLDNGMFIGIAIIIFTLIYIIVYLQLYPYIRTYKRGFFEMLILMIKNILSVSEVLSLRLAVCRDYARFIAAVLLKLYPEKPIYIIMIPRHVACAIEFSGKIYVLDQKLPIMTLNGWRRYWCKRFGSGATMEVYKLEKEVIDDKVYFVPKLVKRQKLCIDHSTNIEQILNKLSMKLFNFTMKYAMKNMREGQVSCYEQDIEILNHIEALDDDDLVIESLYRLILLKLENELLDKTNSVIELKPYVCSNNALCVKAIITSEARQHLGY